jgi:NAD(P)-dependent dehydrogenase (short-subunit alcohol dehydrogenase family)
MQKYLSLFSLKNKNILLTGATGFLGRRFALGLAQHGARVLIVDRDATECDKLVKELTAQDLLAKSYPVDLSDPKVLREWAVKIVAEHRVDVLINNASVKPENFFQSFSDYSLETFREVMTVNFEAPLILSQVIGHAMASQGQGNIINLGSIYGYTAPDQRIYEGSWDQALGSAINTPVSYAVSKAAVHQLTKYLCTLWGSRGVRVNTLSPGGVEAQQNQEFQQRYSHRVPMDRMAKPDEMVGPLIFLCADASSYLTGHNLLVDGGWSTW